jgi:hypothetical protein
MGRSAERRRRAVTATINIPGISGQVNVTYEWRELGGILAGEFDGDQADLLDELATRIHDLPGVDGLMQVQYIADLVVKDTSDYNIDKIRTKSDGSCGNCSHDWRKHDPDRTGRGCADEVPGADDGVQARTVRVS